LLISEDMAIKLAQNDIGLTISIDGNTKEVYEHIRRGGSFKTLTEKLTMLNKIKKFNLVSTMVVMKSNYHQIESFVDFAREYNIKALQFIFINSRNMKYKDEDIFKANKDKDILLKIDISLKKAAQKCREHGISFNTNINQDILNTGPACNTASTQGCSPNKIESQNCRKSASTCNAPWKSLDIDVDGNVWPSANSLCNNIVGNLNTDTLDDIWNGEKIVNYRQKIISGQIEQICNLKDFYNSVPFELLRK